MQKKKEKIIMLIPNLDFGGAQRVFHHHATFLANKYEVIECAFNLEQDQAFPTKNKLVSLGVPAGKNTLDKVYRFFERCWKFHKLKLVEKPLISVSHLEGADYVNILSFGKEKKILVVHGSKVHDREMVKTYGWVRSKILLPLLYKRVHLIVTVSEGIKTELTNSFKIPAQKIVTIYNSFDSPKLKEMASLPSGLVLQNEKRVITLVTSGRLAIQKNQLPLLHILKYLKDHFKLAVKLFFVGDGPLKGMLKSEAEKLSLTASEINTPSLTDHCSAEVLFLGYQKNPFKFYKEMDLFLFPSAWEGFPMALGEAMVLGMPVLSSDCPTGPIELLLPNWEKELPLQRYPRFSPNGVLLPIPNIKKPESIQVWAETIVKVMQDVELRKDMGKSAQKRMELLDHEIINQKWLNIVQF